MDFVINVDDVIQDEEKFGKRSRLPRIKIQPGEERTLRLLMSPAKGTPHIVRVQHWGIPIGVGKTPPQLCAWKHSGEPCYYCEVVNEYYNSGDPRKVDLARRMKAGVSYISNVLDVNDPVNEDSSPKVQVWQYSQSVFRDLAYYYKRRDEWGDIAHPETGRDIRVISEIVGKSDDRQSYTRHQVKLRGNSTPLAHPQALEVLHDLDEVFPLVLHEYEVQQGIFEGTLDFRSGKVRGGALPPPQSAGNLEASTSTTSAPVSYEDADPPAVVEQQDDFVSPSKSNGDETAPVETKGDDWDSVLDEETEEKENASIGALKEKLQAAIDGKQGAK
jgi:hypothetical protein